MKLFYNPSFTGNAYVDFEKAPVLFDAKIVNTAGLCGIIRLHAGICSEVKDYGNRFVDYYAAMKKFMAKNSKNILAESFKIDSLNTAKKCLEWRDTLALAGWTKSSPTPTERMKVLSGVEEFFNDKSAGEELLELISHVEGGCTLPELEIYTSSYYEDFSPSEVRLLKALIKRGVPFTADDSKMESNNISKILSILNGDKGIKLDTRDDSFEIWNFEERDEAVKYLSLLNAEDFDVWINKDNKEFDNWQKLEGKKTSGSEISGIPQIAELLAIGLTIFERPLNIYNIVEWLNTSINPLSDYFRKKLAEKICSSGGYYNEVCRDFINKEIAEYPDSKERIEKFLPDINQPYFEETDIAVTSIKNFVQSLRKWCTKKIALNKDEDAAVDQLGYVINQTDTLLLLLEEMGDAAISYSSIEAMSSIILNDVSMKQYAAQAGCKNIINSYADFCNATDNTIWCDFYQSGDSGKLTYSFLSPIEKESFQESFEFWDTLKERDYLRKLLLTPFAKTKKKLVLVTIDKIGSAPAPKSPIYIQLEKYFADTEKPNDFSKNLLAPFVKQKKLDESLYKEIKKIDNRMESVQEFVEIKNTDFIKDNWPEYQSSTSLESLIPHPLDYVLDTYVAFKSNALDQINDLSTTKGKVAHKVIQILFSPKEGEKCSGTAEYIRAQIDKYFDKVFEETVQSEGAILLIKDSKLELQKFKKQLSASLEGLLKGISENNLHVVACEKSVGYLREKNSEKVIRHGSLGELDIKGFIDMQLEDSEGNPYIFDFKWTMSDRYAQKLKENKSVQLALYKKLVEQEAKRKVKAVAYYLLPLAKFVSTSDLKGAINFKHILTNSERVGKDLLKEIQNSYKYRRDEIFSGKLEETAGWAEEEISYEQQREDLGFLPMEYYENKKNGPYNPIAVIKGRKQGERK
ncbi:MAG: PD-(D/E)XK nuclease family protein [Treponema sp.]|nr:PD-(D/E)XK nuclease family protein [Treponema sp.]